VTGVTIATQASRMMGAVTAASPTDRYDLVVIGGGSAGLTAADFAAQIGAKVLIAAERLGGDCTWTGCIPSKALIRIARLAHEQRRAVDSGFGSGGITIDFPRAMAEVHAVIARVYSFETPEALATRGIDVAIGPVHFLDRQTIEAGDRRVRGERFVLCTGAGPVTPAIPGLEGVEYLTYETVFDLTRLPAGLIVIGAGATGIEIAQTFARLGSRVSLIDQRPSVLPDADPEASALLQKRLASEGVSLYLSESVSSVAGEGSLVQIETAAARLQANSLLVATGRRPRIEGLGLERAGVEVRSGAIRVTKNLQTTNPIVYAAGDVTGGPQFTHYAGWQGYIAARNALLPGSEDGLRSNVPWAVFTDPEVAQAGINEAEARAQFKDVKVHRIELERVDRAQTEDERDGFLKLITRDGGKVVGATVVSRAAGECINELALAIDRGLTVSDLASTIHAYPTFGFAIQQLAAEVAFEAATSGLRGRAIQALRRRP
jgi:pyruvate/2-oxoglutarate dehydrogenase complex dihydrolipoamide dehydrogenase (E3) component